MRSISKLLDDLFNSLPADERQNLLCVSVSARLSGRLVEALSACEDGSAFLERLERDQLFCTCIDESNGWFVIHPVFRQFLERQAKETSRAELAAQHERAARWFASKSLWSEAIHHVLAAGDVQRAREWIGDHAMVVVGEGDFLALLAWERQLRERLLDSPVRLRLAFAWALGLTMMTGRAFKILEGVEASLNSAPGDDRLRAECGALRAVLHGQRGDYERALASAAAYEPSAHDPPWVKNAVLNVTASCFLHTNRWEEFYALPAPANDPTGRPRRDVTALVYRLSIRGVAAYRQGDLAEAGHLLEMAMSHAQPHVGMSDPLVALPAPTLALVLYEQDRRDDAERVNAAHFEVNRNVGPIDGLSACYRIAARVAAWRGQHARARALLDEGERIAVARDWSRVVATMCLEQARLSLLERPRRSRFGARPPHRDRDRARGHQQPGVQLSPAYGCPWPGVAPFDRPRFCRRAERRRTSCAERTGGRTIARRTCIRHLGRRYRFRHGRHGERDGGFRRGLSTRGESRCDQNDRRSTRSS